MLLWTRSRICSVFFLLVFVRNHLKVTGRSFSSVNEIMLFVSHMRNSIYFHLYIIVVLSIFNKVLYFKFLKSVTKVFRVRTEKNRGYKYIILYNTHGAEELEQTL